MKVKEVLGRAESELLECRVIVAIREIQEAQIKIEGCKEALECSEKRLVELLEKDIEDFNVLIKRDSCEASSMRFTC